MLPAGVETNTPSDTSFLIINFELFFIDKFAACLLCLNIETSFIAKIFLVCLAPITVISRGEIFIFIWDDSEESAKLLRKSNNEKIQFQWLDDEDSDYYFELRIQFDEITKDVSLIVTDFADDEEEVEESKLLWTNQISDLKKVLGST